MKNKKWKREAKRLLGKSDIHCCDCSFCELFKDRKIETSCLYACEGQIRKLELKIKERNVRHEEYKKGRE